MISVADPVDRDVTAILSEAFRDDPVLRWIKNAPAFVPSFFEMILPAFIEKGLTYIDDERRGAAAWLGPQDQLKWLFTLPDLLRMTNLCGLGGMYRLWVSGSKTQKYQPREPHYYLFAIGALPGCQGQGVGSSLISYMLRRCDQEQMPAYLENSREANLAFYQGHGFQVQREIRFAGGAPPLWLMWREPQTLAP
jgi:ribosomal protein S18 acetylase RimI-like enzyme